MEELNVNKELRRELTAFLMENNDNDIHESSHIGAVLRDRRIKRGLSLDDVSKSLRIQQEYLSAIELLEIHRLPAIGYVLGYVRAYAKILDINPENAVAAYKKDSQIPENLGMRDRPHFVPKNNIRLPRGFFAASTAVAVATVLTFWYGLNLESPSTAMANPTVAETADVISPATPKVGPNVMTIKATAASWIQLKDTSGNVIISRILVPGETWQADKEANLSITARDGGAIEIFLGENSLGHIGAKGQSVRDISIPPVTVTGAGGADTLE